MAKGKNNPDKAVLLWIHPKVLKAATVIAKKGKISRKVVLEQACVAGMNQASLSLIGIPFEFK